MLQWLYRYVFRGIGILAVIGMITILYLSVASQMRGPQPSPTGTARTAH